MYADKVITIGDAVVVCIFSIAVVFLVLLAISYMIDLVHWILTRNQKPAAAPAAAPAPVAAAPAAAPAAPKSSLDPVLVAAAVAAYLGTSTDQIIVRSIRRAGAEESPWVQAGRTNNSEGKR